MLSDSPLRRSLTTDSNFRRVRKCTGSGTEPGLRGQWKTEIVQTVATDSLLVWEVSSRPSQCNLTTRSRLHQFR